MVYIFLDKKFYFYPFTSFAFTRVRLKPLNTQDKSNIENEIMSNQQLAGITQTSCKKSMLIFKVWGTDFVDMQIYRYVDVYV